MSGICAVWRREKPGRTAETLASISRGLSLAASEWIGQETDQSAGVGVSGRFASQQLYENPRVLIACDAELHNEDELRGSTGDREQVAGRGQTAALLAALYERFGCGFVEKLRGAFSLILWDRRERKWLAAIDGFGIKRLVYYQDRKVLLLASRVDALVRSGGIDLEINPRGIANVLNFTANLAPETILNGVHRLSPGTLLVDSGTHTHTEKYWDMRYGLEGDTDERRLSRQLESVVEGSVATLCKNQPFTELGAFLSGGTDSSTVVGMMSRVGRRPVKAFSIGFQEQPFNELAYAELAAKKFNAEHHTYLVGADDCFEALPQMVRCFDEPFGNSSAIPTYFCARLAAQHGVKVLLAGDDGNTTTPRPIGHRIGIAAAVARCPSHTSVYAAPYTGRNVEPRKQGITHRPLFVPTGHELRIGGA